MSLEEFEGQVVDTELPPTISAYEWLQEELEPFEQVFKDTFDKGDKICIIGGSKTRKSFFLLQMALSLAAGIDFLNWKVVKARRVLHIQFEIQPHHFHARLKRMAHVLEIEPADIGDRLHILNGRGLGIVGLDGINTILELAKTINPDVIIVDPLYKLMDGIENAIEGMKPLLDGFDKLARETGAAISYVHHDAKGFSGERNLSDRGAGSGVLARDYDASIILTPHAQEEIGIVVETLLRNYKPQDPFVILWDDRPELSGYCFSVGNGIAPSKQTSKNHKPADQLELQHYLPVAQEILQEPLPIGVFHDRFKRKTGLTDKRIKGFQEWAVNKMKLDTHEERGKGKHLKSIGTPEAIAALRPPDTGAPLTDTGTPPSLGLEPLELLEPLNCSNFSN